jgi:hypothetical protein
MPAATITAESEPLDNLYLITAIPIELYERLNSEIIAG